MGYNITHLLVPCYSALAIVGILRGLLLANFLLQNVQEIMSVCVEGFHMLYTILRSQDHMEKQCFLLKHACF